MFIYLFCPEWKFIFYLNPQFSVYCLIITNIVVFSLFLEVSQHGTLFLEVQSTKTSIYINQATLQTWDVRRDSPLNNLSQWNLWYFSMRLHCSCIYQLFNSTFISVLQSLKGFHTTQIKRAVAVVIQHSTTQCFN